MTNENETIRDVCDDIEYLQGAGNGGGAVELFGEEVDTRELSGRILAAYEREMAAKDAEIARFKAALKSVLELAGCLTNMSIIDAVHYKATHASMKYEDGHLVEIEDPVAMQYKLLKQQFIPVFKMLKDAVREAQRIMKEGGEK